MKSTKEPMLHWLGGVLEANAGRSKLRFEPEAVAPDGFLTNVAAGGVPRRLGSAGRRVAGVAGR